MAIRGVYTEDEKKMLANFEQTAEAMSGWSKPGRIRVATADSLKNFALVSDYWNPLWRDDDYAAGTRWGGIIAVPMYQDCIVQVTWYPDVPPNVGFHMGTWIGENWDFFKPIHANDYFKIYRRPPQLADQTSLDGKELRMFRFLAHDADLFNQKDELVSTYQCFLEFYIYPEPPARKMAGPISPYIYTKEELALLTRTEDEEEIRGAKVRWWEDVNVGDNLKPVVIGPTTIWDMLVFTVGRQELDLVPLRVERRKQSGMTRLDPTTNVTHHGIEHHLSEMSHGFHYGAFGRQLMARCVTNWMGDDGFITKFGWRHVNQTPIGDSAIGRGKVTNKRVENGEHLVDITVWLENLRGYITEVCFATISLLSRKDIKVTKI